MKKDGFISLGVGAFIQPLVFDLPVSTPGKLTPVCQCPVREPFTELPCWITGWSDWLRDSPRETPQEVFPVYDPLVGPPLYLSMLPTAITWEGLTPTAYGISLLTNKKLWQVKVQGLPVIVSDCKNIFKAVHRQTLIPSESIQPTQSDSYPTGILMG